MQICTCIALKLIQEKWKFSSSPTWLVLRLRIDSIPPNHIYQPIFSKEEGGEWDGLTKWQQKLNENQMRKAAKKWMRVTVPIAIPLLFVIWHKGSKCQIRLMIGCTCYVGRRWRSRVKIRVNKCCTEAYFYSRSVRQVHTKRTSTVRIS